MKQKIRLITLATVAAFLYQGGVLARQSGQPQIKSGPDKPQDRVIDLEEAVRMAQRQSFEYKVAINRYQSSMWNYRNYMASFRPMLYLDGTTPNYSRAINKITLPTGEDAFVHQNQAYSALNLGIRQNVTFTGGILQMSTSLNRIDVFGPNRHTRYSSIPASISYQQSTVGYNPFRWRRQIEPLRFESAQRELVTGMEQIGSQVVQHYFELLSAQSRRRLSRQNLASADTLYAISQERFKLGTVSQSELLQLRLNVLNAQNQSTQDSVNLVLARQQFARFLGLPDDRGWELDIPEKVRFFEVTLEDALRHARKNSQQVLDSRLQRLEAEQTLAQTRAENKLKFSIQANLGISNTAPQLGGLFHHMENQQNLLVGFSLPILDWGQARTQRSRAEAQLALVQSQIEQRTMQFEQEIALHTSRWNLHRQQLAVAAETRAIAGQNYEMEVQRYMAGNISINDLNTSQNQKDNAANAYIQAIRTYWELYFTLRRLTLYDFEQNRPLVFTAIIDE